MRTADDLARWLRYAAEDLRTAETLLGQPSAPPRQTCYLARQAARKGLEAVLIFLQIDFGKTTDLEGLRDLLPERLRLKCADLELSHLTRCGVEVLYPGSKQEPRDVDALLAVKHAKAVGKFVSTVFA